MREGTPTFHQMLDSSVIMTAWNAVAMAVPAVWLFGWDGLLVPAIGVVINAISLGGVMYLAHRLRLWG